MVAKRGISFWLARGFLAGALLAANVVASAQATPAELSEQIAQGVRLHDQRNFDGAIGIFRQVLQADPANAKALHELAFSLMAKGDCAQAIDTATRGLAVERDPVPLAQFHVLIGNCRDMMGNARASLESYRSAIELNPRDFLTLFNMGVTLMGVREIDNAQLSFERAIAIEPGHPGSHYALSRVFHAQGKPAASMLALLRFLSLEPAGARAAADMPRMDALFAALVERDAAGKVTIKLSPRTVNAGPFQAVVELGMATAEAKALAALGSGQEPALARMERMEAVLKIAGEAAAKDEGKDFVSVQYAPFFAGLNARGYARHFAWFALQARYPAQSREWLSANRADVMPMLQWIAGQRAPLVTPPQN